jgi:hypothetical protein
MKKDFIANSSRGTFRLTWIIDERIAAMFAFNAKGIPDSDGTVLLGFENIRMDTETMSTDSHWVKVGNCPLPANITVQVPNHLAFQNIRTKMQQGIRSSSGKEETRP